jgi:putative component of membrane protein insertase Oxa1/YidC/SpoIIIJ protein YidD
MSMSMQILMLMLMLMPMWMAALRSATCDPAQTHGHHTLRSALMRAATQMQAQHLMLTV